MAPRKKLGHKIVVKIGGTAIGCLRSVTPPEKTRDEVDVTCHGDAIMEYLDSDPPNQGTMKFEVVYEPGETNTQLIDTLFDDPDIDDREGDFSIEYQMFSPLVTDAFSGRILKITPKTIAQKEVVAREVEIRLTTAVTRTVAT